LRWTHSTKKCSMKHLILIKKATFESGVILITFLVELRHQQLQMVAQVQKLDELKV
jgi:hypothetical protein